MITVRPVKSCRMLARKHQYYRITSEISFIGECFDINDLRNHSDGNNNNLVVGRETGGLNVYVVY